MVYNQTNQKLMKEIRQKFQNHLKVLTAKTKVDDDDLVGTDIDRETNDGEYEKIYQIEEIKKMIQNQKNQKLMKEIREKIRNYFKAQISKRGDDDDLADTDIDREKW